MKLTDDIDPQGKVNLLDLDAQQRTAVHRVALALDDTNEPNVATATLLAEILRTFLATHSSIRFLLSKRDDQPELGADAVSLAREQIEKVFLVSLLIREWEKYLPNTSRMIGAETSGTSLFRRKSEKVLEDRMSSSLR